MPNQSDRLYGRFDFGSHQSDPPELLSEITGGTCLVDGVEILCVHFADTEAGIVRTFDVFRDGKAHWTGESELAREFSGREVDCSGQVFSETLRGKIELFRSRIARQLSEG